MLAGKVMAFGCFDLLHPGHLFYLKKAKSLGSELTVVVARDKTIEREKGHSPLLGEKERLALVRALKPVDRALLGAKDPEKKFSVLQKEAPGVIALGHDHLVTAKEIREKLREFSIKARVTRLPGYKPKKLRSSKMRKRVDLELDDLF